jgi:hypothetical protein
MSKTMPTRWHTEPGYTHLMECIRGVRIYGQSPNVACEKLKISTCVVGPRWSLPPHRLAATSSSISRQQQRQRNSSAPTWLLCGALGVEHHSRPRHRGASGYEAYWRRGASFLAGAPLSFRCDPRRQFVRLLWPHPDGFSRAAAAAAAAGFGCWCWLRLRLLLLPMLVVVLLLPPLLSPLLSPPPLLLLPTPTPSP